VPEALRDRRWQLALMLVLATAVVLRFWAIAPTPLWLDESWSRWMAGQDYGALWRSTRGYDTHPPVYYALLKGWSTLSGVSPAGLRLLSVLAGLAMLPLAWAAAGRIGSLAAARWPRLMAVALVAVSPPLVVAARQARPYALFALAFGIALLAALALLEGKEGRARVRWWAGYAASLAACLWLHSLSLLFAAALGGGLFVALGMEGRLRRELAAFAIAHGAALVLWLPGLLILAEQRARWSAGAWLTFVPADVPAGLARGLATPGPLALILFALAGFGAYALARRRANRPALVLLAMAALAPAAATILVSLVLSPVFLPRTLVPSVLPLLLLAAAGIAAAGEPGRKRAVAVLALAIPAFASILLVTARPEERWNELALWLELRVGDREEVWLLPNELALPFAYGAGGARVEVRAIPAPFPAPAWPGRRPSGTRAVPALRVEDARALVADARVRGRTGIWVVSRFAGWFDPEQALPRALGAPASRDVIFAPLVVDHYRL